MKNYLVKIWNHNEDVFKVVLVLGFMFLLLLNFPREVKFRYDYQKGKPWVYQDLLASFNFAVLKSESDFKNEKDDLLKEIVPFYRINKEVYSTNLNKLKNDFYTQWTRTYPEINPELREKNRAACETIFAKIYQRGVIKKDHENIYEIAVLTDNTSETRNLSDFFTLQEAETYIRAEVGKQKEIDQSIASKVLLNALDYNIFFDQETTTKEQNLAIENLSPSRGMIQIGERIISNGEIVTEEKALILDSYKAEFDHIMASKSGSHRILWGQTLLVGISFTVLLFFLFYFRRDIFNNNKKIFLILIVISSIVVPTSLIIKYDVTYLYLVPMCLGPILIRSFFDTRLALIVHIVTIFIIGFLVPNSFQFIFLQLITGIITIISLLNMRNRAQFFVTSLFIFITYSIVYTGLVLSNDGKFDQSTLSIFGWFGASALLTLFAYPLIFIFEKLFGYVTDVSLMELSDSNSKLLRILAIKAPGTFQHTLHVANLTEEAVLAIGGNALLARAGAMYHDIGKMIMANNFTENQVTGVNPHDELDYMESAAIIIGHVLKGIELAKKYNIPEEIIDFIRTHHGTSKTKYFHTLYKAEHPDEEIDESAFTYHGPKPFSKETAVLMIADSVEATARSLKEPNEQNISEVIDRTIQNQMNDGQLANADITLKDITTIKKVIKRLLINMYHDRIEYPK